MVVVAVVVAALVALVAVVVVAAEALVMAAEVWVILGAEDMKEVGAPGGIPSAHIPQFD